MSKVPFQRFTNQEITSYYDQSWQAQRLYQLEHKFQDTGHMSNMTGTVTDRKQFITKKQLKDLKLITKCQMKIGTTHFTKYYKGKLIRKCFKMNAIMGLLQDQNRDVVQFSVYNYPLNNKHYDQYFKVGSTMYIKQPYIKRGANGYTFIRIDDPNDIQFQNKPTEIQNKPIQLQNKPTQIQNKQTAEEFKERGNECYNFSKFFQAIEYYKKALNVQKNPQKICILNSNIAISFFQLNLYEDFKEYIEIALKHNKDHPKSIYRKAEYLIYLNQFTQAAKYIETIKSKFSKQDIDKLYEKLQLRRDCSQAKFDWFKIFQTGKIEEYKNKKVKVSKSKIEGLGIFACEDIEESQIILVQNFMASIQQNKTISQKSPLQKFSNNLDILLRQKCLRLANLSRNFQKKLQHLSSLQNQGLQLHQRQQLNIISASQVDNKIKKNSFTFINTNSLMDNFNNELVNSNHGAIWEFGAFFNHCCQSNAIYFYLNTKMIVIANRKVLKGQEILISYFNTTNYDERSEALQNSWNIKCKCVLCQQQHSQKMNPKHPQYLLHHIKSKKFRNSLYCGLYLLNQNQFKKFQKQARQNFHFEEMGNLLKFYKKKKSNILKDLIFYLFQKIFKISDTKKQEILLEKWSKTIVDIQY